MELQESVLRNISLILGWQASPRYADYRGRLTERLRELVGPDSEWTWDGPAALISGPDEKINLGLSPTELIIFSESAGHDLGSFPAEAASAVLEQLAISEVLLVGSGSIWLAPASSEEELRNWFAENLGAWGRPAFYDAFGGKPKSLALEAHIGDDDLGYEVELKAITAAEAAEGDDFMSDDEEDFPPISLYFEVRHARMGELKASDAVQWFSESLSKNVAAAQRFEAALREDH